jgi:hypothetical protein
MVYVKVSNFDLKEIIMKSKWLLTIMILLATTSAYAYMQCTTSTLMGPDGKVVVCQTCCNSFNVCTTYCK